MVSIPRLLFLLGEADLQPGTLPDRGAMPVPFPILNAHLPFEKDNPAYADAREDDVALSSLYATQRTVDAQNLQKFLGTPDLGGLPIVTPHEDGYAIVDGHHRLAAARMRGETTVRVKVHEDAPANAAGNGGVAGLGVGPKGEPGVDLKKKRQNPILMPVVARESKVSVRRLAIAPEDNIAFWLIGSEVYRAPMNTMMDTVGMPMGKRWECSFDHWQRYRKVFNWAQDVNEDAHDTFAGADVFDTDTDTMHRTRNPKQPWERFSKYVGMEEEGEAIRAHARKNWKKNIILRDAKTGVMTYLRKRGSRG